MNFFVVDDSETIRTMLINIIEENQLGEVVGEASDGSEVNLMRLSELAVDIMMIDLLMPKKSGIDILEEIGPHFNGKIIMVSQVESKEMIGKSYSLGIENYIMKPINQLEVVAVIQNATKSLRLERSLTNIQKSLTDLATGNETTIDDRSQKQHFLVVARMILNDFGLVEETTKNDFIDILKIIAALEENGEKEFASLQKLYKLAVQSRLGTEASDCDYKREQKTYAQRIRRAVHSALENTASLGLADFFNSNFEKYASLFFDFSQVRLKMMEIDGKKPQSNGHSHVNIKKFIIALYVTSKG